MLWVRKTCQLVSNYGINDTHSHSKQLLRHSGTEPLETETVIIFYGAPNNDGLFAYRVKVRSDLKSWLGRTWKSILTPGGPPVIGLSRTDVNLNGA